MQHQSAVANASIAQLVEQRIENPRVPGSIPGRGTTIRKGSTVVGPFFVLGWAYTNVKSNRRLFASKRPSDNLRMSLCHLPAANYPKLCTKNTV